MKKPDKLPTIDPRTPDLYRVIVETAQSVRARQSLESAFHRAEVRAAHVAALAAISRWREDDEDQPVTVVVPDLTDSFPAGAVPSLPDRLSINPESPSHT